MGGIAEDEREAGPPERMSPRNFYGRKAMSEAEGLELEEAQAIEGLEHEIALLRVRLREAAGEHKDDLELMTAGVGMLVRAVAAQYRLSPKSKKDLAERMAAVLNSFGDQLLPPDC